MIKMTKNIEEANLITHGGVFHVDEVMATVILSKIFKDVTVCRTSKVPNNLRDDAIVYDIGFGKFDHHQKGGNGCRKNGVPYASAGLIWKEFGHLLVKEACNPYFVWKTIDKQLIQGIDATDCGTMPGVDYPARAMTLSAMVFNFNPAWDSTETPDEKFLEAVAFTETVFNNVFYNAVSKAKAKETLEKAISESKDHIMVLERFAPWQDYLFTSRDKKAEEIQFVVFPSNRGGYNWQGVTANFKTRELRKPVPIEWRGLQEEELQRVTGVESASFCHSAGFIGGAATLEGAIAMAKIAVNA